jgi:hypothetical protein
MSPVFLIKIPSQHEWIFLLGFNFVLVFTMCNLLFRVLSVLVFY